MNNEILKLQNNRMKQKTTKKKKNFNFKKILQEFVFCVAFHDAIVLLVRQHVVLAPHVQHSL